MVEAEDFDQRWTVVDPWSQVYSGPEATTNVDFQHTPLTNEHFNYRPNGIPRISSDA
jgi:hypothetical protein